MRELAALACATGLLLIAPRTLGMAQVGGGDQSCQSEGQTGQGYDPSPHVHTVTGTATVHCPQPKADGPVDPGASSRTTSRSLRSTDPAPPPANTECHYKDAYVSGVSLTAPGPGRKALWTPPDPAMPSSADVLDGPSLPAPYYGMIIAETMSRVAGEFRFLLHYRYDGTYNGVDWQCRGKYSYADTGTPCWGDDRTGPVPWCIRVQPVGKVAPSLPNPPDPMKVPQITSQLASLQKSIDGGTVGTSPHDQARQFVTLPTCFWVNGAPPVTAFEVTIDAPPNSDGRGLTYVYRVTVGLQKVHWDYGDGTSWDGTAGTPYDGGGGCSNPHTYERISATGNPGAVACPAAYPHPSADDGCYHVTATETYAISATAYWNDGGPKPMSQDLGSQGTFSVTPHGETFLRVLQIEGIPVTG